MTKRLTCDGCELVTINGHVCHETGCPEAWRDQVRQCCWCGRAYQPDSPRQQFCDESCAESEALTFDT